MPDLRAAKEWRKRPTAVIMRDDWYGHRDPFTGDPQGDKDEWLDWDHLLAGALQTIEDYTDGDGLLVWERDDEAVEVDAIRKVNKFHAARDNATKGSKTKPYQPRPGEYFLPRVFSRRPDKSIQTFREWVNKTVSEEQDRD